MTTTKMLRAVAAVCFLATAAPSVQADEISELRQQMAQMQARLDQLEQAQTVQNQKIERTQTTQAAQEQKIAAIKPGEMTIPETLKWVEKLKFYGDFRYRYENISSETNGTGDNGVNRNRIRVRLGMTAQINDEMNFDLRIATGKYDSATTTGNGDPTSTNQNLGDSWTFKGIWLDRAYLTWTLKSIDGLSVLAGKFGVPFMQVGKNQLIWDGDLNMEGIGAKYNRKMNDNLTAFANAGGFYVRLDDSDTDELGMFGIQGGLTAKLDNDNKLTGGVSYFDFGNTIGETTFVKNNNPKGNTISNGRFVFDYDLFEAFAEYSTMLGKMPVGIHGDYVVNTASAVKDDTGWLIGASFNKCKDAGSWEFSYDYRDLEKDAVVGAFSDSDFIGGGSNGKGHRFGFTYQLAKNVQGQINYFMNEKANSAGKVDDDYNRLQADIMLKF